MLYATNRFPGDGMTTQYEISFVGGYLDRTHVKAYIEGADLVQTPVTLSSGNFLGPYTIVGLNPIPVGSTLVIYRDTPKAPIVDFVNGSRFTESNLDTATRQGSFIAAEGADAVSPAGLAGVIQQIADFSGAAGAARDQAVAAKNTAVASSDAASLSESNANDSKLSAAASAASALSNKNASDTAAANAGTSASTATTQAGIATTKASEAENSATLAWQSKTDAAASAALAASYVDAGNPNWNDPKVDTLNGGSLAGFRNAIINGDMLINQRGITSVTIPPGGFPVFTADRWRAERQGTQTVILEHVVTGNGVGRARWCIQARSITPYGNQPADYTLLEQRVEGFETLRFRGATFTLSFLVKATRPGTYTVAFRNKAGGRSYIAPYTIASANVWQAVTITVTGGIPSGDADGAGSTQWNVTNDTGLKLSWMVNGGSTYATASTNQWLNEDKAVASTQTQGLQANGDTFSITEVQLEVGTKRTPLERRPYATEVLLCKRYFEVVSIGGGGPSTVPNTLFMAHTPYMSQKRSTPIITARTPQLNQATQTPTFNDIATLGVYAGLRSSGATEFYYAGLVEAASEL